MLTNHKWKRRLRRTQLPQSLALGSPAPTQPLHPPSIDSTFVYPIFCKLSATSADRNPPPQYKIIFLAVSGTWVSISRSIIPLPMCTAPGKCPFAHSLSSLTSTKRNFSPLPMRCRTSATFVSLTRVFASLTSFRNCGECFMEILPFVSPSPGYTRKHSSALSSLNFQTGFFAGFRWQPFRPQLTATYCSSSQKSAHNVPAPKPLLAPGDHLRRPSCPYRSRSGHKCRHQKSRSIPLGRASPSFSNSSTPPGHLCRFRFRRGTSRNHIQKPFLRQPALPARILRDFLSLLAKLLGLLPAVWSSRPPAFPLVFPALFPARSKRQY